MSPASDKTRFEALREILIHQRDEELAKIKEFRRDQADETFDGPGDEMEIARSLNDIELHASLIERSEERLKAIEAAFSRLEGGSYGICDQCGEEISLPRLRALPFAISCVDCQQNRESRRAWAGPAAEEGNMPHRQTFRREDEAAGSEEDVDAHEQLTIVESAFGPEEDELEQEPFTAPPRRGRRRRVVPDRP